MSDKDRMMAERPRAYRLDSPQASAGRPETPPRPASGVVLLPQEDAFAPGSADAASVEADKRARLFTWGRLAWGAASGLLLLAMGLWTEQLIRDLASAYPSLGYLASALALLLVLSLLVVIGREIVGILRERRVAKIRLEADRVLAEADDSAARSLVDNLCNLYGSRAETASVRAELATQRETIIDADDRLAMAERLLMIPFDLRAKRAVASAARQVSLVTAVSPRAIIDVAFTLYAAARLVRSIAAIYGGRPGFLGFMKIMRAVMTNLLVTGGMAAGDSLIQQAMGHGLAARLSAKAGEGVLNGLLTARIGIAAIAVCRPLPFIKAEPPRIGDVAGELLSRSEAAAP